MSGCAIGAKWSTLYTEILKAESTGHFEIRPDSMVVKIDHDSNGKVSGVVYADKTGTLHEQKARVVCVRDQILNARFRPKFQSTPPPGITTPLRDAAQGSAASRRASSTRANDDESSSSLTFAPLRAHLSSLGFTSAFIS